MEETRRRFHGFEIHDSDRGKPATFAFKGSKHPKKVDEIYDAEGLTPEEVNDIRYSGIRLDMSTVPTLELPDQSSDPTKLSDIHFRMANDAASGALSQYRIMMQGEIREKLIKLAKNFDDVGMEVFAVMHMIRAFLGKRPDHAPVELTVVRLRLATGVESPVDGKICHMFPSPLPMPFGKGGEYRAAQNEWHEIDEDRFKDFSEDFVLIFYNILSTLDSRAVKKSLSNFQLKLPLVICKSHTIQSVVMMVEYLHQRALLSQKAQLPTSAPESFVVPEKISLAFCEIRAFELAVRSVLRELLPTFEAITEKPNTRMVNLCYYHKTTNKVDCTTYCVSEMVEQLLLFTRFWGLETPKRFVEGFHIREHIDLVAPTRLPHFDKQDGLTPILFGDLPNTFWKDHTQPITSSATKTHPSVPKVKAPKSDRGSDIVPLENQGRSPFARCLPSTSTGGFPKDTKSGLRNDQRAPLLPIPPSPVVYTGIGRGIRRVVPVHAVEFVQHHGPSTDAASSSITIPLSNAGLLSAAQEVTPTPTPLKAADDWTMSDLSMAPMGCFRTAAAPKPDKTGMPPRSKLFSLIAQRANAAK